MEKVPSKLGVLTSCSSFQPVVKTTHLQPDPFWTFHLTMCLIIIKLLFHVIMHWISAFFFKVSYKWIIISKSFQGSHSSWYSNSPLCSIKNKKKAMIKYRQRDKLGLKNQIKISLDQKRIAMLSSEWDWSYRLTGVVSKAYCRQLKKVPTDLRCKNEIPKTMISTKKIETL